MIEGRGPRLPPFFVSVADVVWSSLEQAEPLVTAHRVNRPLTVDVEWDPEAELWIAEARDILLFTEAATLDELRAKVPSAAAALLEEGPDTVFEFDVSLVVRFGETVPAAA
jgi:hypothetical protein